MVCSASSKEIPRRLEEQPETLRQTLKDKVRLAFIFGRVKGYRFKGDVEEAVSEHVVDRNDMKLLK